MNARWLRLAIYMIYGGILGLTANIVLCYDSWESGGLMPDEHMVEMTDAMLQLCMPRNIDIVPGRPIPTNSFWGNLITCEPNSNITQPMWPNPFAISIEMVNPIGMYGFAVGYPAPYRFFGNMPTGPARFYAHAIHKEVLFSASEFAVATPRLRVVDWTDLSVTMEMQSKDATSQRLSTTVVQGMVFFTTEYYDLTPRLEFMVPIMSIQNRAPTVGSTFTGVRFIVTVANGMKWLIYTKSHGDTYPIPLTFKVQDSQHLVGESVFNGFIQIVPIMDSKAESVFDTFQDCTVLGGELEFPSDKEYGFLWKTKGDCSSGLLHYALPHQQETMKVDVAQIVSELQMNSTVRGVMHAYKTMVSPPVWRFSEVSEIQTTYYPRKRISHNDVKRLDLLRNLRNDIQATWSISTFGSFYFNGKAAQKYASLCLMANDQTIVGLDSSLLVQCIVKLEAAIKPFVDNAWHYKLTYDKVFGGIVSSEGFINNNMNADFGNPVYNDHHFHYGYWVYASAIINYLHPTWKRINDLNAMTRLLLRDVANPNDIDPYFPKFRAFDWYLGHSYSHGVTTFADGKDQESSSEDINFSYALYLYGKATGHERMQVIGKLMSKVNARAARTYFLMTKDNTVHPPQFIGNKVPGILFDNKVDYATWFSAEKYCIHGIQMLPFTPMTENVRTKIFVQEEWEMVLSKEQIVVNQELSNPWLSLLYTSYAVVDREAALQVLAQVTVDDGLTRSWALYFAAQSGIA